MIILPNISQDENAAKDDGNMGVITSGNAKGVEMATRRTLK
jgi:hypothetical protein